jgi:hypothetical protein
MLNIEPFSVMVIDLTHLTSQKMQPQYFKVAIPGVIQMFSWFCPLVPKNEEYRRKE